MKLFKLNDDKYLILLDKFEIEGNKAYITLELIKLGVESEEIYYALKALDVHDMADFGVNKTFVYSKKIA